MTFLLGCLLGLLACIPLLWIIYDQHQWIRALRQRNAVLQEGSDNCRAHAEQQSDWNRELTVELGRCKAELARTKALWGRAKFVWPISSETWEN